MAHHLPRLLAQASSPSRFTPARASSLVAAIEVGGITATVGMGRPLRAVSSRIVAARSAMVSRVVRPGIQPSAYSAASRAERGVAPQYQNGTGRPGLGSMEMFSNE